MAGEQDVEDQQNGADGDGGIGNVEGGPAVGTQKDLEEIGDAAVKDAVGDVAGSPAEQQRKAGGVQ